MKVRIRFGKSVKLARNRGRNRRLALLVGALLTPAALVAWILGFWRIAADLNWTSEFAIPSGPFSYWQVWIGLGAMLQWCARLLNRYGRREEPELAKATTAVNQR